MIYRIYSLKDTFITNYKLGSTPITSSNFGACEILHLYKKSGISGAVGWASSSSLARILTMFDVSEVNSVFSSSEVNPMSASYFLRLADARHDKTLPSSFDANIQAVSQDWDEGSGFDVDTFFDSGYANWSHAKSNVSWSQAGASGSGVTSSFHFDIGNEDLFCDVTSIVLPWISGTSTNNGFLVKLAEDFENNNENYYIKMFHSKQTFFKDKRPYLEVRWDDSVKDDRNNFVFDVSGNLYLRNSVRGQLTDIQNVGTGSIGVRISDLSGAVGVFTGSHSGITGIYKVSFAIPSASYSGSTFSDQWFNLSNTASVYFTDSFNVNPSSLLSNSSPKRYYCNIKNLKDSYYTDEVVRFNVFTREHDYNPARVLTASLDAKGTVITNAYYSIKNDKTSEIVVPFGTGSSQHTRLSYDENGNYFNFYMSSLSKGNVYRISLLFDVDGQKQIITGNNFKFRVI